MKTILLLSLSIAFISVRAQMVNGSAYMKGNYIEVGIDSLGGFEGTDTAAAPVPAGMHFRSNNPYFGFVANPQEDGWVNYDGDFYTPGTPENGWGIEIVDSGGTVDIQAANNRATGWMAPLVDIPGSITAFSYTSGITTVTWEGHFGGDGYNLDFILIYTLNDTALFYTTDVTIINNGPGVIENFYYYRNIDPDNNESLTSDYVTDNTILSQAGGGSSLASVKAEQTLPWLSTYSLFADDTMARVSYGGFSNRDGSDIWDGTGECTGTLGTSTMDAAVSLAFKITGFIDTATAALRLNGTEDAVASASVTYSFKSIFGAEALQQAMQDTLVETGIHNAEIQNVNLYPNPLKGDEIVISGSEKYSDYAVYDITGKEIESGIITGNTIHFTKLNNYSPGQYFLTVRNENTSAKGRIIFIK